jgi:hypothetical protein
MTTLLVREIDNSFLAKLELLEQVGRIFWLAQRDSREKPQRIDSIGLIEPK